tara:strand:- start:163 stop:372 length:210 start_codon:yes stop_codon:yes gene_type:complete
MKVVVTIIMVNFIYGTNEDLKDVRVRKCPPNYKPQEGEFVVELEDYTDDDIKNYLVPCPDFPLPDKEDV